MRILKFILYTILVCCILWTLVLTAGPRLITVLVKQNYDNSVLVSGLRITPKLGISADRVDYLQLKTPTGQILNGFSRAIKLNWGGLLTPEPFVRISVGPTVLQNIGNASSQKLFLSWKGLKDLKNFSFSYTVENLQSHVAVEADIVAIEGKFDVAEKIFRDIKFDLSKIKSDLGAKISAESISGKIDFFEADFNYQTSSFSADIDAFGIFLEDGQVFLPTSDLSLEVEPGTARLILQAESISSKKYLFEIGSLKILADGTSLDFDLIESAKIKVADAVFPLENPLLRSIDVDSGSGNIYISKDGIVNFEATGKIRETFLETDALFIAELPSATFDISSEIGAFIAKKYINSNMFLSFESSPRSFATIVSDIKFLKHSISECLKSVCSQIEHQINYEVKILDEKINGLSECSTLFCGDGSSRHRLETSNTEKFITNIVQTSTINPVLVTFLFSELLSGKKTKSGHVKEY